MVVVNMSNSWHPRVRFGKQLGLVDCRKMRWIMNAFIKVCVWLFIYVGFCMPMCMSVCVCVQITLCLLMFREKGNNVRNALGDSHIDYGFLILLQSTFDTFHYDYLGDIDHWMKNVHHLSMLVHAYHNWIKGWPRISFARIGSSLVIHRTWILTSESKSQKIYTMNSF